MRGTLSENYIPFSVMLSSLMVRRSIEKYSSPWELTKRVDLSFPLTLCRFEFICKNILLTIPVFFQALEITKEHLEFPQLQVPFSQSLLRWSPNCY